MESDGNILSGLSRRTFLGALAVAGAVVAIPPHGATASAAPALQARPQTLRPGSVGSAQADLGTASGALAGWGAAAALALDGNSRSVGVDLGSAASFNAIELVRRGDEDPLQRFTVKIGVLTNDTSPATGVFANFNLNATAALDYLRRSVGIDLQAPKVVRRVQLHNRGATTRVVQSDYTLWVSNDNVSWAPLTGWTFAAAVVSGRMQHTFGGFEVTTRYVKVNFAQTGTTGFDFILDSPLENARAFGSLPPADPGPAHRIVSRDISVWVSDDNVSWERVTGVQMANIGTSLWLYDFERSARYVKVHMHREDTGAETFVITNIQTGVRVHHIPADAFVAAGGGEWTWITPVVVSNPTSAELRDRAVYISDDDLDVPGLIGDGRLQSDRRDLRFATTDGQELHAYWDGDGFYVRIPSIDPSSNLDILAYSGNPAAGSRIAYDSAALQVEYGQRALTAQTGVGTWGGAIKAVQLPGGLMMAAAGTSGGPYRISARFSADGGRSWGAVEPILPVVGPPVIATTPGGFLLDPVTDVLSLFFLVQKVATPGGDFMNPAQNDVQLWVARTTGYDLTGRPIFGTAQHIPLEVLSSGLPVAWGLSYSNGIRTISGAHLYPVSYMVDSVGTFTSNVLRSTDGGATWSQSATELVLPSAPVGYERGITEVAITQLDDGSILLLARQQDATKHYFVTSTSTDDGATWSTPTDSAILSSNTAAALFRDGRGGHGLTWPGHNGFGQVSYYRNNLTAAYSDDDGASWHGYQDLLAASSISHPGWGNINETRTGVNVDSWETPDDGRVFAWGRPTLPPLLMLIDDYDAFVRDSHGALDVPGFRAEGGAANGTELTAARWWRTTRTGGLDLADGSRAGRRAVRLLSSPLGDSGASRLFPGVRQASIRFRLRFSGLATDLHLALQEGFSAHQNSRGTALSLKLTPSGELLVTTDNTFGPIQAVGHRSADTTPATGNLTALGVHQVLAVDFQNRSVGADFGAPRPVTGLELIDNDLVSSVGNRVNPSLLQVWKSDTNAGDWVAVTGWTGTKTGNVISLSGPSVTTRFIKITHPYSDSAWTLANDEQKVLRALPDANAAQVFSPLATPTTLTANEWHRFEIRADIPGDEMVLLVNGVQRSAVSVLHPAEVLTHLLLLGAAASSGEVRIDEFLVQDTASGLPVVASVGSPYAVS